MTPNDIVQQQSCIYIDNIVVRVVESSMFKVRVDDVTDTF